MADRDIPSRRRSNRSRRGSSPLQEPAVSTAAPVVTQRPAVRSPSPSRATSQPLAVGNQPQPIKDAIHTAFDQAPSTTQMNQDFVKKLTEQVTEQVIKSLTAVNVGGPGASPPVLPLQTQHAVPTSSNGSVARSPSPLMRSTDSFPAVTTPPSPHIRRNARDRHASPSPERPLSDAGSEQSSESKESDGSLQSQRSTQSNRETTPPAPQPAALTGLRRTQTVQVMPPEMRKPKTMPRRGSTSEATALRKDSKDSESGYLDGYNKSRAKPASVAEEGEDEGPTTLEKIWQPLFDNGKPTARLGQLLRGLARHLIEDYEPRGSLVISPQKMLRFLTETKVAQEHYPWPIIFGGRMSWTSISMMYRKLLCQHHLTQQQVHETPLIPALTPQGFELFMTCLIQAHPETEFERLSKAVRDMPISNADDGKERFPKELSRRLLPLAPSMQAEQRLISSLNHEPTLIQLERGASAMPPPPPQLTPAPPEQPAFRERERNPYSKTTQRWNAVDDDDVSTPSIPIERERKPYYATKEGGSKRYGPESDHVREREVERDGNQDSREPSRPATGKYRPELSSARIGPPSRQNTGDQPQVYNNSGSADATAIPRRNSKKASGPPPSQSQKASHGRRRSPTPRSGFARSDPVDLGSIPSSQYASNLGLARDRYAGDQDEDGSRYNSRRPSDGHGSAAGVNNALNQFAARNGTGDDRRRSWYPGMAPNSATGIGIPNGGTDGYGSHAGNSSQPYGPSGQH